MTWMGKVANFFYTNFISEVWQGNFDFLSVDVKVALITSTLYTPDAVNDQFLSHIPSAAIIRTSDNLSGKAIVGRAADATDIVLPAVIGPEVDLVVLYQDTGVSATSLLICGIDTGSGLPFTASGRPVRIVWSNSSSRIAQL